jgi:hypothetical protein
MKEESMMNVSFRYSVYRAAISLTVARYTHLPHTVQDVIEWFQLMGDHEINKWAKHTKAIEIISIER